MKMKKRAWVLVFIVGLLCVLSLKRCVFTSSSCEEPSLEWFITRMESIVAQLKIAPAVAYVNTLPQYDSVMYILPKPSNPSKTLDDIWDEFGRRGLSARFTARNFELLMASDEVYVLWEHPLPDVESRTISAGFLSHHGRTLQGYIVGHYPQSLISAKAGEALEEMQWASWVDLLEAYPTPQRIRVLWNGEETFGVSVDYQTEDGRRICWEGTTERPKKITERIVIFQL